MARPEEPHDTSTVAAPRSELSKARAATFVLLVVDGPDKGKSLSIDGSEPGTLFIGQSASCALRLTDRMVSRRHAAILSKDRRLRLTDASSMNGTIVNGLQVSDVFLAGGETLRIGETLLRVDLVAAKTTVALTTATNFGRIVGASEEMRRIYPLCERLARADIPLVLEGETGTGKEILAESIHEESPRANGPFVVFDCTAVPPNLVESDLFGHERGSFTGAVSTRKGVFEQAHGGTLLIDEIGDLDLSLQPKLLRALERSEIRRVGGDQSIKVDVRVLCATRRDLDREIQSGRFRDDLFHRIAVARIELPPLRRRSGDVTLLARHFYRQLGHDPRTLSDALLLKWDDDPWPGNVRELRNAVQRQLALGDLADVESAAPASVDVTASNGPTAAPLDADAGADPISNALRDGLPYVKARARVLEQFEQRYIENMLAAHGGNVMRAAAASGIARRHFQRVKARSVR